MEYAQCCPQLFWHTSGEARSKDRRGWGGRARKTPRVGLPDASPKKRPNEKKCVGVKNHTWFLGTRSRCLRPPAWADIMGGMSSNIRGIPISRFLAHHYARFLLAPEDMSQARPHRVRVKPMDFRKRFVLAAWNELQERQKECARRATRSRSF